MTIAKEPSQRQLRVGEEIRHGLAQIIAYQELRDPDLFDVNITITEVRISPDLKNATAFIIPLGGGDDAAILAALKRASPFLRGRLAKKIKLKHVPRLSFKHDNSFDEASHIDLILRRPEVAKDLDDDILSSDGNDDLNSEN